MRYAVSNAAQNTLGSRFPFGTLAVNLIGCLLIGLVFGLGETIGINPNFRLFFITGFLGALTTLSTLALETINGPDLRLAIVSILANNIGGLLLVRVGLIWSRAFAG